MTLQKARSARDQKTLERPMRVNGIYYPTRRAAMDAIAPDVESIDDEKVKLLKGSFYYHRDLTSAAVNYLKTIVKAPTS